MPLAPSLETAPNTIHIYPRAEIFTEPKKPLTLLALKVPKKENK